MKYPFPVKHNGIDYEPGQEVPIGQEPVKENADKEMTINEIREELRALGVTEFPSNKKSDLIALLEETKANLESTESDEEEEVSEEETESETESESESEEEEVETEEDEDSDLLNKIANEQ